jgi:hypothetical protein
MSDHLAERNRAWNKLCVTQNSFITIWQSYMRWFAWHFAINIGALGAVIYAITSVQAVVQHAFEPYLKWVAIYMAIISTLGALAAIQQWRYDNLVRARVRELCTNPTDVDAMFGSTILVYAKIACLITNILIVAAWVFFAVQAPDLLKSISQEAPTAIISPVR